jgi:hypothetical protein
VAKSADWIKIKVEYETTNTSYRKIAEKYGVSFNTLKDRAKREEWAKAKEKTHHKIATTTLQKAVVKIADRNARILSITDKIADKIESAVDQLEDYIVTNRIKTKTITYDEDNKKPSKEVIVEEETKEIIKGIVDRQGLTYLTSALEKIQKGQRLSESIVSEYERHKMDIESKKLALLEMKSGNSDDAIKKSNERVMTIAELLNNPVEDRKIEDFEEDDES